MDNPSLFEDKFMFELSNVLSMSWLPRQQCKPKSIDNSTVKCNPESNGNNEL